MGCRNQAKTQRGQKCTAHLLAWEVYQAASCAQWLTNDCMMMELFYLLAPVLQFLACGSLTSCLSLAPGFVFHQNSGCQSVWHSRQQHAGAKLAHSSLLWENIRIWSSQYFENVLTSVDNNSEFPEPSSMLHKLMLQVSIQLGQ